MKFAHLADCHVGGWRDPKLRDANNKSFCKAINVCLDEQVDFVLIAGDLFNTAVPAIDSLRIVVEQLKVLKDNNIPVYFIAGSHDFSPSGKTMLDVLEQAGLAINVAKGSELPDGKLKLAWTFDKKTGVKITGMIGKKGGLETGYYAYLAKEDLEKEQGQKIFLFHSALAELKPKELEKMEAMAVSLMPKNCEYYAGGHVHIVDNITLEGYKNIVYPGPVFPNNFAELEKLKQGNMVIVDNWKIKRVPIIIHKVICISVNAEKKTPLEVESIIKQQAKQEVKENTIVLIRVAGCLEKGRPSDINWNDIIYDINAKKAFVILKNTAALTSKELEIILVKEENVEVLESSLLRQHAGQFKLSENDIVLAQKIMHALCAEKADGEKSADFETRLHTELDKLFQ